MALKTRTASRNQTDPEKLGRDLTSFLEDIKLSRGTPLSDQIYRLIRRAIVTGRLGPGEIVNEIEIAKKLGTSRTPVREAVKKVEDEGLIDVRAQAGTFVSPIDLEQAKEAYIIRTALERESVRRAVDVITDDQVEHLYDLIHMHSSLVKRSRFEEAIGHDDAFHRSIAEVNGYQMMWKVIDHTKAQMDRCRLLALPFPGAGETTIAQHTAIADALQARDAEAAVKAMSEHLETSLNNTINILKPRSDPGRR